MTQLTAIRRLAAVLTWSRFVWDDYDLMQRSVRAIENSIDDVFDQQHIPHATLALLHSGQVFPRVIARLIWLKRVLEVWYGGVTDIFHDKLADLLSRLLYKDVYQALREFKRQSGQANVHSHHSDTCLLTSRAL
jgi:hypothetical protein